MTDTDTNTSTDTDGSTSGDTSTATDEFKAITSQEDFEARLKDRLTRERSKFSDYKDVKAKAARLDQIEEANKSELERANTRTTTAESERDDAKAEALRLRVAVEHGIGLEDADLFLTGRDEESLKAQAKRLTEREAERKKNGNVVPREGATTTAAESDEHQVARALFGGST